MDRGSAFVFATFIFESAVAVINTVSVGVSRIYLQLPLK